MIRFGVAGNCDRFYEEGFKQSAQAPEWLSAQGLTAYEYSAGHGVSLSEATARAIGEAAGRAGVRVSIHAPYYINLASEDPEKDAKNEGYFLAAARAVRAFGGTRVVFHPGTPGRRRREDAMARATARYLEIRQALDAAGYADVHLCPETMGRPSQLGTLEEILALSDRVAVLYNGKIAGVLPRAKVTVEKLGRLMSGLSLENEEGAEA